MNRLRLAAAIALAAALAAAARPATATAATAAADSAAADSASTELRFRPIAGDTLATPDDDGHTLLIEGPDAWRRAGSGEDLLTDPDEWAARGTRPVRWGVDGDYNRVDNARLGVTVQYQRPQTMLPRIGLMLGYAFRRGAGVYGVQLEQPLTPPGRLSFGFSMLRRVDHTELQQVPDWENSVDLVFVRQDFRDYFEREGYGAYLSWRVPDFSTVSLHYREDDYSSLATSSYVWTLTFPNREIRPNPGIDDGRMRSVGLRLARQTRPGDQVRDGFYHWIQIERAGFGMGGDFDFMRALADLRAVLRVSPGSTVALRGVFGTTWDGAGPAQKRFQLGGPSGLRAYGIEAFDGNQALLGQVQYTVGLWQFRRHSSGGGLAAIVFLDAGTAWQNPAGAWDIRRQHVASDAGFGLGSGDGNVTLTFAKSLSDPSAEFVASLRFTRPF